MNPAKKELIEAIEQSLLSQCQAMFDSHEWADLEPAHKEQTEELIRKMLKACARNVASYTELEK